MTYKRCGHERGQACGCQEDDWHDHMDRQPDVLAFMAGNHGSLRKREQMRKRVDLEQWEESR